MDNTPQIDAGSLLAARALKPLQNRLRECLSSSQPQRLGRRRITSWQASLQRWLSRIEEGCEQLEGAFVACGVFIEFQDAGKLSAISGAVRDIENAAGQVLAAYSEITNASFRPPYDAGRVLLKLVIENILKNLRETLEKFTHAVAHPEQFRPGGKVTVELRLTDGPELRAFNQWVETLRMQQERTAAQALKEPTWSAQTPKRGFWSTLVLGGLLSWLFTNHNCDN